jgi:hypothetical protein
MEATVKVLKALENKTDACAVKTQQLNLQKLMQKISKDVFLSLPLLTQLRYTTFGLQLKMV